MNHKHPKGIMSSHVREICSKCFSLSLAAVVAFQFPALAHAQDVTTVTTPPTVAVAATPSPSAPATPASISETKPIKKQTRFYGGAGGFNFGLGAMSWGNLDGEVGQKGIDDLPNFVPLTGGVGYAYLGENVRLGGGGLGGRVTSKHYPLAEDPRKSKVAIVDYNTGGMLIDYVFQSVGTPNLELSVGTWFGGGEINVELVEKEKESIFSMHTEKYGPSSSLNGISFAPRVGAKYKFVRWLSLDIVGSYQMLMVEQVGLIHGATVMVGPTFGWFPYYNDDGVRVDLLESNDEDSDDDD